MAANETEPKSGSTRRRALATAAGFGVAAWMTGGIRRAEALAWPGSTWGNTPSTAYDSAILIQAINYARSKGTSQGSGLVIIGGQRATFWGDQSLKYKLFSATKSFGGAILGLAIADSATGVALTSNCRALWSGFGVPPSGNEANAQRVTIEQLATHTAGFDKTGGFIPIIHTPGTRWSYSDGGANWLADVLTVRYRRDLAAVARDRIFSRIGISAGLTWRQNAYRPANLNVGGVNVPRREFGSGIDANVDAMARFGLLMARDGAWSSGQLVPSNYVSQLRRPRPSVVGLPSSFPGASNHYGLLWWNNADGVIAGLPRDAFWAWGKNEQLILAVPSLDLVAARCGPRWASAFGNINVLKPFFEPLARAVR